MIVAKADSAATNHYRRDADLQCLTNIQDYAGPSVTVPNNEKILPKKQGLIPLSNNLVSLLEQQPICLTSRVHRY